MKTKSKIFKILFHVFCIVFALTSLYPILWMLASSLKDSSQVFVDSSNLIPKTLHWENYKNGFKGFGGISFFTFFNNTFIVVLLATLGTLISCPFIAYGFARIEFKFKNFWFMTVMISLMLPAQIVLVPQYILFDKLKLTNTFIPLVLPMFFGSAFFIFQHMQFIRSIPIELDEAAKLDGCSRFKIFTHIMIPLIKPSLVTSAIFQFYWKWDDFFGALVYLNKPKLYTVTIALRLFSDPSSQTDWGAMFAMGVLSLIPSILVFFAFQKYIVEGISTSGMKG